MEATKELGTYPATQEQRRAGMAMFRAKLLAAKKRVLAEGNAFKTSGQPRPLTKRERAALEDDIKTIEAAQIRLGEVKA